MKQRFLQFLSLAGMLLSFASCDPRTEATYFLENSSSGTIYYYNPSADKTDTVPVGGRIVIGAFSGLGSEGSNVSDVFYQFDSARIFNDTANCTLPLQQTANWTTEQIKKWEYIHHFVVRNKDF